MNTGSLLSGIRCPHCGNTVPVSQFCSKCGNALPQGIPCRYCGKISRFGSQCSNCGKSLGRVIGSKDFELTDLRDLGNALSGTISPGIAAPSSAPSLAQQIKTIALGLLAQSGYNVPFYIRPQSDGSLEFIVSGQRYGAVDEIADARVRIAIQQAVAEWQKQN